MRRHISPHTGEATEMLYHEHTKDRPVTAQAKVKIYVSKGRHSINLPTELVRDSAFPFKPLEELVAKIDGDRVIIEKKA